VIFSAVLQDLLKVIFEMISAIRLLSRHLYIILWNNAAGPQYIAVL